MKICVISSAALPSPPVGYGGLEAITASFAIEAANRGHEVVMFTIKPSSLAGTMQTEKGGRLTVVETGTPETEREHYLGYRDFMEKNFQGDDAIVWDNTWQAYPYLSMLKRDSKLKIIHTHHGEVDPRLFANNPPPTPHPRWLGLSRAHAQRLSEIMACPVRHVWNGIYLSDDFDPEIARKNDGYLLSLNRMSQEKGIHNAIDLAIRTRNKIVLAGDDLHVSDHKYVSRIINQCRNSGGLAKYYGLVDDQTKLELLVGCKATVSCTDSRWLEGFGLYSVESMAMGKPCLAVINGGLAEIIEHKKTGFLASTTGKLEEYVNQIEEIDPMACRKRVEEHFTVDAMCTRYLDIFEGVLSGDQTFKW